MSFGDQTDRDGVVRVLVRDPTHVTGEDFAYQEVLCGARAQPEPAENREQLRAMA
jgi:hypothetical protein